MDTLNKLLDLSESGSIELSEKQLLEMSEEEHIEIYAEFVRTQCQDINAQFADAFVAGMGLVSEAMGVEGGVKVSRDLIVNKMFMNDLRSLTSWIVPKIPYIGLAVGGMTIAKVGWGWWSKETETDEK